MSEYEKKRNEAATDYVNKEISCYQSQLVRLDTERAFISGSDFGREYMRGVEDEAIQDLINVVKSIEYSTASDRFKFTAKQSLEAYNKAKDVK